MTLNSDFLDQIQIIESQKNKIKKKAIFDLELFFNLTAVIFIFVNICIQKKNVNLYIIKIS